MSHPERACFYAWSLGGSVSDAIELKAVCVRGICTKSGSRAMRGIQAPKLRHNSTEKWRDVKWLNKILMSPKTNPTIAHKIILLQMTFLFVIITVKCKAPIKIYIVKEEGNLETNSHKIIKVSHHQKGF